MSDALLKIENLQTSFFTHLGEVKAVRNVSFSLNKGEVLGIVGESGSGKSVTALSCMRLIQFPGKIKSGSVRFKEQEVLKLGQRAIRSIRGNEISMIFQNPMSSLNPVHTVGEQIVETIVEHRQLSRKKAKQQAIKLLETVHIPEAAKRLKSYPHEFSGGMRQRAMIAMSLACQPDLIIADEPTTALDVTIQSQILLLLKNLKKRLATSILLITHDLGVIADICSRVVVMYGAMVMEEAPLDDIFYNPQHPYTMGLLKSIPRPDKNSKRRLVPIRGTPPNLLNPPAGCPFAARCDYAMRICQSRIPPYTNISAEHRALCWLHDKRAPRKNIFNRQQQ